MKICAVKEASELFDASLRTVARIRAKARKCADHSSVVHALKKKRKGNCVRSRIDKSVIHENVSSCPLKLRIKFESLSNETGISLGMLHRALVRGDLNSQSRRIKPKLIQRNLVQLKH